MNLNEFAQFISVNPEICGGIFETFDMDGDAEVGTFEFITVLAHLTLSNEKKRIATIFDMFDPEQNEVINFEQLKRCIDCLQQMTPLGPLQSVTSTEKVKELKGRFRLENDTVSAQQFVDMCLNDISLRNCLMNIGILDKRDKVTSGSDADLQDELKKYSEDVCTIDPSEYGDAYKFVKPDQQFLDIFQGEGIQNMLSERPWEENLHQSMPTGFQLPPTQGEAPNTALRLEHIYGYRSHDCRQNLFFNPNGQAVFHASKFCVQHDLNTNVQDFLMAHPKAISCMDVWEDIGASCDGGEGCILTLWDCNTMDVLATYREGLGEVISMLRFSSDGKYLCLTILDEFSTLYILSVDALLNGENHDCIRAEGEAPREPILDIRFEPNSFNKLVCCTTWTVYFSRNSNSGIQFVQCSGWGEHSIEREETLAAGFIKDDLVTGSKSGYILRFKGSNIIDATPAHTGPIHSLYTRRKTPGIITGGFDGKVIVWNENLQKLREINLATIKELISFRVQAVSEDANEEKILVGTRSSDVLYIDLTGTTRQILSGHSGNDIWGLGCVPGVNEVITGCEDCTIVRWNFDEQRKEKEAVMMSPVTAIHVSRDKSLIAAGCDNGNIFLLSRETLEVKRRIKDRTQFITDIKFSPNSKYIAAAAQDGLIVIYPLPTLSPAIILEGHRGVVEHIDWTKNSKNIRTSSTAGELFFWEIPSGKRIAKGAELLKDEMWTNYSCPIGWAVQGMWPEYSDPAEILSVCKSRDGKLIASGDVEGNIRLYKYPCVVRGAKYSSVIGHYGGVTNLRFDYSGTKLFSTGEDEILCQWRLKVTAPEEDKIVVSNSEVDVEIGADKYQKTKNPFTSVLETVQEMDVQDTQFKMMNILQTTTFPPLPFEKDLPLMIPKDFELPSQAKEPPEGNLFLRKVIGYRGYDTANSVKLLADNRAVYLAGTLGIVMDSNTKTQSFFNHHSDDVVAIDVSADRKMVVTGALVDPKDTQDSDFLIWNPDTLSVLGKSLNIHQGKVSIVRFSPKSNLVLSIGRDKDHSLAITNWKIGHVITTAKVSLYDVYDADWMDNARFATVGKDHIKFWRMKFGSVNSTRGNWKKDHPEPLVSCKYVGGYCISGSSNGNLSVWSQSLIKGENVRGHDGVVYCIEIDKKNKLILSGGKDGLVRTWQMPEVNGVIQLTPVRTIFEEPKMKGIKSIDVNNNGFILIGTRDSRVIMMDKELNRTQLTSGHYHKELTAIGTHPTEPIFATGGDDHFIRTWDIKTGTEILHYHAHYPIKCLDWSSNGCYLIAGATKGNLYLLSDKLVKLHKLERIAKSEDCYVAEAKFAPNSNRLAATVAGKVSHIYIFEVHDNKLVQIADINPAVKDGITHFDWSSDGSLIALNSECGEVRFVSVGLQSLVSPSEVTSVLWNTWTCPLGFNTQGVFPLHLGYDVQAVCRSSVDRNIIAVGDSFQNLKLFRYPSVLPKSGCKKFTGHSAPLKRMRFMLADNILISIGGEDKCVFIWCTDFGSDHTLKQSLTSGVVPEKTQEDLELGVKKRDVVDSSGNVVINTIEQGSQEMMENSDFIVEYPDDGDESAPRAEWRKKAYNPTSFSANSQELKMLPNIKISIDHIFGYRSTDKRNNIFFLNTDEFIFHTASAVVAQNIHHRAQRSFIQGKKDIVSLMLHSESGLIYAGEENPRPSIYIYQVKEDTHIQLPPISKGLLMGVDNLDVSPSGKYLAAICMNSKRTLAIYDIENMHSLVYLAMLVQQQIERVFVADICWATDTKLLTGGVGYFNVIELDETGKSETPQNKVPKIEAATIEEFSKNPILVMDILETGTVLAGRSSGELSIWKEGSWKGSFQANKGGVDAIQIAEEEGEKYILTGGKDCKILIFDKNLQEKFSIDVYNFVGDAIECKVKSIAVDTSKKIIAVGLKCGDIALLDYSATKLSGVFTANAKLAVRSHTGLGKDRIGKVNCVLPISASPPLFITCGDDATLRFWNSQKRKCEEVINLNIDEFGVPQGLLPESDEVPLSARLTSVDMRTDLSTIAVGCADGSLRILTLNPVEQTNHASHGQTYSQCMMIKQRSKKINFVKFSPNDVYLASASVEGTVDIYSTNSFTLMHSLRKNASPLLNIDWSTDSVYVQASNEAQDLIYFDIGKGSFIQGIKDAEWETWSSVIGWPTQGLYQLNHLHTKFISAEKSGSKIPQSHQLLAVGTGSGEVRIYRYPCISMNSEFHTLIGHAGPVSCIRFSAMQDYLYSIGSDDQTIIQWKITNLL